MGNGIFTTDKFPKAKQKQSMWSKHTRFVQVIVDETLAVERAGRSACRPASSFSWHSSVSTIDALNRNRSS